MLRRNLLNFPVSSSTSGCLIRAANGNRPQRSGHWASNNAIH
jgi:hypothetical protein